MTLATSPANLLCEQCGTWGCIDSHVPWEVISKLVDKVYRRFREYVELDDCRQEAWLYYWERRGKLDAQWNDDGPMSQYAVKLRIAASVSRYCHKEKASKLGYHPSDEHFYSLNALRDMLPHVIQGIPLADAPVPELKRRGVPQSYTDKEATYADVRRAYELLPSWDRTALAMWFVTGVEVGDTLLKRRAGAALKRLQEALGDGSPYME